MEFGTYPTGWYVEGDLPNQVAVSTGYTVMTIGRHTSISRPPLLTSTVIKGYW